MGLAASSALLMVGVAACGGSSSDDAGAQAGDSAQTGDSAKSADKAQTGNDLKVAQGASLWPGGINDFIAPILYAKDFDLKLDPKNLVTFSSSTTSSQVLLSGGLDATSTSFIGGVQMIAAKQPVKFFCVGTTGYTALVLGTGDIKTLQDIDPAKTKVAIEPSGGPSNLFMDLVFRKHGLDFRTSDFKKTVILDDSPLRLTALIRGDAQVAIVDVEMLKQIQEKLGKDKVHILSNVMDDVGGDALFTGYLARTDWLEKNEDLAAKFCASMFKGDHELTENFDLFRDVNQKYLDYEVTDDELKFTWQDVGKYGIFPDSPEGISKDRVDAVIAASVESGVLEKSAESIPYEDIVDTSVLKKAEELYKSNTGTAQPNY